MDVWDGGTWRTILVGGLNAGGRGFYALDITNPNAPRALWEFSNDKSLCPVSDPDLGLSFGNPIITKRDADQRWVVLVTSGYNNNVDQADGKGYLYVLDAIKGTLLDKIRTGTDASPAKPSGFARISGWADNFVVDNSAKWVFGGDQNGDIWKIDLTESPARVLRLARALDPAGMPQPITTRPELGLVNGTDRVVYVGTGRYLGVSDLTDPATQTPVGDWAWQQSIYAFKDLDVPLDNLRNPANKLVQQTLVELAGGTARTVSRNTVNWSTQNGWYLDLNPSNRSPGERVNVDPQLALGTLIVASNVPGANACSVGGDSWIYQLDYRSGSYVQGAPNNLVARKQTGALTVGLVVYQLQKGSIVGQIQRSETLMRKEEIIVAPGATPSRRISWREITPGFR
jgi:type IV pilus assembly protein PilY1